MERAPSLAGRRPVVRGDDRALRRQPRRWAGSTPPTIERRTRTTTTSKRRRRYDVFNAGGDERPVRAVPRRHRRRRRRGRRPGLQGGGRRPRRRARDREGATSTASRRRPSTSSSIRSRPRPQAGLVCADGTTVRIVGAGRRRRRPGRRRCSSRSLPIIDDARAANPDLTIHAISSTFINDDINELINDGLDDSLKLTIPLTFIILLFAFGAIVASVVPLVLAITSLAGRVRDPGHLQPGRRAGQPERHASSSSSSGSPSRSTTRCS